MIISIVVAMDENRTIGAGGALPWHLPADLRYFRDITMGKPIVMGRKTHESIGRPLPGRENIVISRNPEFSAPGCRVMGGMAEVLERLGEVEEVMVIGGASIYAEALELATRLYLTEVHAAVAGDVFFPEFDRGQWREIRRQHVLADEKNPLPHSFVLLERESVPGADLQV